MGSGCRPPRAAFSGPHIVNSAEAIGMHKGSLIQGLGVEGSDGVGIRVHARLWVHRLGFLTLKEQYRMTLEFALSRIPPSKTTDNIMLNTQAERGEPALAQGFGV